MVKCNYKIIAILLFFATMILGVTPAAQLATRTITDLVGRQVKVPATVNRVGALVGPDLLILTWSGKPNISILTFMGIHSPIMKPLESLLIKNLNEGGMQPPVEILQPSLGLH